MTDRSYIDWAAIRAAYSENEIPVAKIAVEFGVSQSAIRRRVKRDHWQRPSARNQPVRTKARRNSATKPLHDRLKDVVMAQLERLEARMQINDDVSAADQEREARALGGLIRNFEQLDELDRPSSGKGPSTANRHEAAASPQEQTGDAGDAQDALRRDVAARILRLREVLEGRGGGS